MTAMKKLIPILVLALLIPATVFAQTVLINEVDADQSGTDAAEFVELYDGGVGNTDLTGMSLVFVNGSDDATYEAFDLDGMSTDANGYFVLCGDAANTPNCTLDVDKDTNLIQNGADAVALITGDAVDFPVDTPVTTANLLDAIVYDTDDGDAVGLLVLLNSGQPQVNERDGGDGTAHSNQRSPNGSGGARNTDTYVQDLPTPGAGNWDRTGVANESDDSLPSSARLEQNYPNPFNPVTLISYSLPQSQEVRLSVFDLLGREVARLVNRVQAAGEHQITFNAADLPSGIYIYRLEAEAASVTRKMILLK